MTNIWTASDHHFGHSNILKFTDSNGELIRGKIFKNIDEHDTKIIENHNALVTVQDHVYFLGDVCMNKKFLYYVKFMNGHKRLVRGNHDIDKTKKYLEAGFDEVYGVRVFPAQKFILSHIPIHPNCIKPEWVNIHGHLHHNKWDDSRYRCVSLEQTDYKPVLLIT